MSSIELQEFFHTDTEVGRTLNMAFLSHTVPQLFFLKFKKEE
jgi:hypothetical protein